MSTKGAKQMKMFTLMLFITLSVQGFALGQARTSTSKPRITTITATTEDGRKVILRSNGTWHYASTPPDIETTETPERIFRRKLIKTIKEVETDQVNFIGKPFVINGTIELSNYYNYGYANAQASHYSFKMSDNSGSASVYLMRSSEIPLRESLLKAPGNILKASCLVVMLPERTEQSPNIFAEILNCSANF
jgi:hypothetical protein